MKKDITMKKNSFTKGAVITTLGIVITKILGIIYVIPFHSIIGDDGGALYGYAYTIYLFFISLSSAGIPLAISKIVSEYQALGYLSAKNRSFKLGKQISLVLGILCFLIVIIFAPFLAKGILGDVTGGNNLQDVTFVIRVIASAILITPVLSVYRGFFEGHKFMSPPSISQVLEQFVRVLIIIVGSFITLKVFHAKLSGVVGVALFGATLGAFIAYFYLLGKYLNNRKKFNEKMRNVNEPLISDKDIIRKILLYAFPFIMIDIFKSMYQYIDMFTVVKELVNFVGYHTTDAEIIYSMLSTWAQKFNMIISAVSTGIVVSLIPNLTESIVKSNHSDSNKKVCLSFSMLLFFIIPMTFGICLLSKPIWTIFYGNSTYGPSVLSYYIFVGLIVSLFTTAVTILQTYKDYKNVFIALFVGVIIKFILNIALVRSFDIIGLPAYYGFITASILGYFCSFLICILVLHFKYDINFESVLKIFVDILCGSFIMIFALFALQLLVPLNLDGRFLNIFVIVIYTILGAIIYFYYMNREGITKELFGDKYIKNIYKIFIVRKNVK